ncbi:MAG: flippase-like domain-containing protein [Acidobacteria bacterium]|nr:flippase-like domain-containing protein [Acidobacteriota bacterium]
MIGDPSRGHREPPRVGAVAKGLAAFVALTGAGLLVLFTFSTRDAGGWVPPSLHGGFLLLAVASAVLDIVIGALRYHVFIRKIRPGTSLWLPIRADLANRFVGAVTPSQTGGGPAQVFVLHRGGVAVPDALAFLAVNLLCTLVVFLMAGGTAAWALGDRVPAGMATHLVRWGGAVLLAGLGLILLALGRPDTCARILGRGATRLEKVPVAWARALARAGQLLAGSADRYRATCARFVREDPLLPLSALLLTLLLYLNKFTLAWLVMRGLGADGAYGTTLAVQALLHLVLYVAPTPGGSGIAELATGTLMAVVLPGGLLGPFTLVYRVLLVHAPATVGACVLVAELRPRWAEAMGAGSRLGRVRDRRPGEHGDGPRALEPTTRRLGRAFGI